VRVPWGEAVLTSGSGVPYLAPHLQLLFKSVRPRPKDTADAEQVIPLLEEAHRSWLANQLEADHPWQVLLRRGSIRSSR